MWFSFTTLKIDTQMILCSSVILFFILTKHVPQSEFQITSRHVVFESLNLHSIILFENFEY